MFRTLLLAFSLVACTATQLRVPGSPLGIGELSLSAWLAIVILRNAPNRPAPRPALAAVSLFWTTLFAAECIGLVKGMSTELFFDTPSILHDVFAYVLLFAVAAAMSLELASREARVSTSWRILVIGTGMIILEVANGFGLFPTPADPWIFERLRGWSLDPNQLGFLCANLVLLSVFLAGQTERVMRRLSALGCGLVAIATGVLSQSDSFTVSLAAGAAIYLCMQAWKAMNARRVDLRTAAASVFLFAAPFIVIAALPFWQTFVKASENYSENMYDDNNQGETRFKLWKEAIAKGLEADLVGYGPGPHLTAKSFKRPPPDKFEAHNVVLELFTQGGALASASFIMLMIFVLLKSVGANLPATAAMSLSYMVFSMFHYEIRHPIFWFGVVLCLSEAASQQRRPREAAKRSERDLSAFSATVVSR
jgi:hypothetical protein